VSVEHTDGCGGWWMGGVLRHGDLSAAFDFAVKKWIKIVRSYAGYKKKFYAKQSNIVFLLCSSFPD
jgi:hypothetical protein